MSTDEIDETSTTSGTPAAQPQSSTQGNQSNAPGSSARVELYQAAINRLAEMASTGRYRDIAEFAERTDITLEADREPVKRFVILGPLTLAYLILDDLPPARFALARLPEGLLNHALSKTLFSLVAATWDRKYTHVYTRAQALVQLVMSSDFFSPALGDLISSMVSTFVERFRERTIALLATGFTSMPAALLQSYLGLAADQTPQLLAQNGWTYNASTQIILPERGEIVRQSRTSAANLKAFHVVADSVAKLEL